MAKTYTLTVTLTAQQISDLGLVADAARQPIEFVGADMLARGVKDTLYRKQRNKDQWQERKEKDARLAELEAKYGNR